MPMHNLIEATTEAKMSEVFTLNRNHVGVMAIPATDMMPGESIVVQMSPNGTDYWQDSWVEGKKMEVNKMNTGVELHGPYVYRVVKTATEKPVGVSMISDY